MLCRDQIQGAGLHILYEITDMMRYYKRYI